MKRFYVFVMILASFIVFSLSGCRINDSKVSSENSAEEFQRVLGSVCINNESIDDIKWYINGARTKLPFVKIARALGMTVTKIDDTSMTVTYGSDVYVLDYSSEISLYHKEEESGNLFKAPPGSTWYYCSYENGDIYLNSDTLRGAFSRMGCFMQDEVLIQEDGSIMLIMDTVEL